MRGNKIVLKMLSGSKKEFTEWDEAIFLAAFQVFENAVTEEPNILSRFRYKCERDLASIHGTAQAELDGKVKKAKELLKWWNKYKRKYSGDYRVKEQPDTQKEKFIELASIMEILWD